MIEILDRNKNKNGGNLIYYMSWPAYFNFVAVYEGSGTISAVFNSFRKFIHTTERVVAQYHKTSHSQRYKRFDIHLLSDIYGLTLCSNIYGLWVMLYIFGEFIV